MFVPVVTTVNDTVAVTVVAAFTLLDNWMEGDEKIALKIAAKEPCVVQSRTVTEGVAAKSPDVPAAMVAKAA